MKVQTGTFKIWKSFPVILDKNIKLFTLHTNPTKVFHLEFYDIKWLGKSKDRWRFEFISKNT